MSEGQPPAKRRRVGNTRPQQRRLVIDQSGSRILQLSDDVLMLILKYLSTKELIILADTCLRLKSLCLEEKSLWMDPDFSGHPMELKRMKECLNLLHGKTRSLTLEGLLKTKGQVMNLSEAYLGDIAKICPEIRSLRLQHFYVNAGKILFEHLPSSLTKLSLLGSEFHNLPQPYFKNIHTKLPNLQEVNVTDCGWVTDYFLWEICKIETLKVISIRDNEDCYITKITKRGISNIIATGASHIERLTLVRLHLCDGLLIKMASEMKMLTFLDIRHSSGITTDGVKLFNSIVENRPGQFCQILFIVIVAENKLSTWWLSMSDILYCITLFLSNQQSMLCELDIIESKTELVYLYILLLGCRMYV